MSKVPLRLGEPFPKDSQISTSLFLRRVAPPSFADQRRSTILNPDHQKNKQDIEPPNSKLSSRTSFFRGVSRTLFHASGDSCIPAVGGVKD